LVVTVEPKSGRQFRFETRQLGDPEEVVACLCRYCDYIVHIPRFYARRSPVRATIGTADMFTNDQVPCFPERPQCGKPVACCKAGLPKIANIWAKTGMFILPFFGI
jgi:hypothetical protein